MRYEIELKGISPIIMHNGAAGLDTRSPANIEIAEITRKKASNRTDVEDKRMRELECHISLWLNSAGTPTIPEGALRAVIEQAARKLRQGPQVREGLIVEKTKRFIYDESLGTTADELCKSVQFTTGVVVKRNRVLRTRARFDVWGVVFVVDTDTELVDAEQLASWLDIGGRRIGLGDWRPQRSGHYGRFETIRIDKIPDN